MGGTNFVPTFRYEPRTRSSFSAGCLLFLIVNLARSDAGKTPWATGNENYSSARASGVAQFPRVQWITGFFNEPFLFQFLNPPGEKAALRFLPLVARHKQGERLLIRSTGLRNPA